MALRKRLNKNGTITWVVRLKHAGREIVQSIGPSKREAQLVEGKLKAEIREGKFFDIQPGQRWTYTQLLDRYLAYGTVAKRPGTSALDHIVAKQLRPVFGSLRLPEVTKRKVLSYLEDKLHAGLAPSTVNYHLAILRHSFTMAVQWELLRENPLAGVKLPAKIENERVRYLLPDEYTRLLSVCNPMWQRLVTLAVHTGLRKGQLMHLRWDRIDLTHNLLVLPPDPGSKKKRAQIVELNSTARAVLGEIQAEQARAGLQTLWCFYNPRTGEAYRRDADSAWYTALRKAGLTDFHFHDLRHTMATWLRMSGADLLTIKEALGHADIKMTLRYAHITPLYRRAAMEKLVDMSRGKDPDVNL
jgi:integrase